MTVVVALVALSFGLVRVVGVVEAQSDTMKKDEMMKDGMMKDDKTMKKDDAMMEKKQ